MEAKDFIGLRKSIKTPSGEIAYVEQGSGPAALFVHGVLLNGALWRNVIDGLKGERRCIAVDLLGHGGTRIKADQNVTFPAQAAMLEQFLDAMGIDQVDLVANDSGGGISQIFAANHPERIRTFTITNADTHDNYPPPALMPFVEIAKEGELGSLLQRVLDDAEFRTQFLGTIYERPADVNRETMAVYLEPLLASPEATRHVERFIIDEDNSVNVAIEPKLKQLQAPTLIVWGTGDIFFDKKWAYWLKDTIPGATEVIEVPDAKIFFPEERPEALIEPIKKLWRTPVPA